MPLVFVFSLLTSYIMNIAYIKSPSAIRTTKNFSTILKFLQFPLTLIISLLVEEILNYVSNDKRMFFCWMELLLQSLRYWFLMYHDSKRRGRCWDTFRAGSTLQDTVLWGIEYSTSSFSWCIWNHISELYFVFISWIHIFLSLWCSSFYQMCIMYSPVSSGLTVSQCWV